MIRTTRDLITPIPNTVLCFLKDYFGKTYYSQFEYFFYEIPTDKIDWYTYILYVDFQLAPYFTFSFDFGNITKENSYNTFIKYLLPNLEKKKIQYRIGNTAYFSENLSNNQN
jgi:hypothetical protein